MQPAGAQRYLELGDFSATGMKVFLWSYAILITHYEKDRGVELVRQR